MLAPPAVDDKNSFQSRSFSIAGRSARRFYPFTVLALAAGLGAARCVPTKFTFEETAGVGGSPAASSASTGGAGGAGGEGGAGGAASPCEVGSQCDALPPKDWEGFFVVTRGVYPSDGAGSCPDGVPPLMYFGLPSEPMCTDCKCTVAETTCSTAALRCYYADDVCTEPASAVTENAAMGCTNFTSLPAGENLNGSCKLTQESALITTGTCTAETSALQEKEPWGEVIYACPPPPDPIACGPGQACAPTGIPGAQFICIGRPGEDVCPDGYPYEIQAFKDGVDTRSCEACSCGPITCNNGAFEIYDGLNCNDANNPVVTLKEPGCVTLSEYFDSGTGSVKTFPPSPEAECPGGGGLGSVETTGPMKFCCK
ncbi:MAG TPA: hypothetical protein VE093_28200 [Polyangiaceae bacterium]|nr:hypothetical protein [Polyangiaceae bacterium]